MMKNMIRVLALTLCLALAFPAALAQEAYTPDQVTADIFADAFDAGKIITGSLNLDLEIEPESYGLAGEEAAQFEAMFDVLRQTTLTFGAGKIDSGLRVIARGEMTDAAGANAVDVDAALDITLDGLAVESDLIEGKRVSAKWETILALCGASDSEIAMIMSLKEIDFEEALAQLVAQIEPMIDMAVQLAAPYVQTVVTFVEGLPIEVAEDLVREDYPPTAVEIGITITQKDLGTLLGLLADQLEQDATLTAMIDMALAQADAGATCAELIAAIREEASYMTDTSIPVTLYVGMDENGVPLYAEASALNEEYGQYIYGGIFLYEDEEQGEVVEALLGVFDMDSNPLATLYAGGSALMDENDPHVGEVGFYFYGYEGENPIFSLDMAFASEAATDSELPAYDMYTAYSMYANAEDGEMQIVSSTETRQGMTAAGGEYVKTVGSGDTYVDGVEINETTSAEMLFEPTADGGLTGYYRGNSQAPDSGIIDSTVELIFASEDYDAAASAALEAIALETVSNEKMEALMAQLGEALMNDKLPKLMSILPQEVLTMIEQMNAE